MLISFQRMTVATLSELSEMASRSIVGSAEIFPALQRDRDVAVFPDEIVEGAEIEFVALLHARVGEKFYNLQLSDLVRNGLTRTSGKRDCFLARGLFVHRDFFL